MSTPTPQSLADKKLEQETEHLRLQNEALQKPEWKSSAFYVTMLGLVLSVLGNIQQCRTSNREADRAREELRLKTEQWDQERQKLQVEIQTNTRRLALSGEDRTRIQTELAQVVKDIASWDEAIFKGRMQLKTQEMELDRFLSAKENIRAEYQKKSVDLTKDTIAYYERELTQAKARRTELEGQLMGTR